MARYLCPLTNYGFRKIFGEKDIMIAFLTDLLNPVSPIDDIILLSKELESYDEDMRNVIYDLLCKTKDGGEFIAEIQREEQTYFSKRILDYVSHTISEQDEKGRNWDLELHPIYGIFFQNSYLASMKPQSICILRLKADETGKFFTEKLNAYTLGLDSFRDNPESYFKAPIEYWLYNLANMIYMTEELPFQKQQSIFGKMGSISELSQMYYEEYRSYIRSWNHYRDYLAVMKFEHQEGYEEGLKIGIEEAIEEGREEKAIEIATNMKSLGYKIDIIVQVTGLSISEIESL